MSSEFDGPDVIALLSLLGPATDALVLRALDKAGLSGLRVGHGYVVQRLVDRPSTVGEICSALGVTQQAVSKTVGELVDLGYVRRGIDPADHRRRPLELTSRGVKALAVARNTRRDLEAALAQVAGPAAVSSTREVLLALVDVLGMGERVGTRRVTPPADTL